MSACALCAWPSGFSRLSACLLPLPRWAKAAGCSCPSSPTWSMGRRWPPNPSRRGGSPRRVASVPRGPGQQSVRPLSWGQGHCLPSRALGQRQDRKECAVQWVMDGVSGGLCRRTMTWSSTRTSPCPASPSCGRPSSATCASRPGSSLHLKVCGGIRSVTSELASGPQNVCSCFKL